MILTIVVKSFRYAKRGKSLRDFHSFYDGGPYLFEHPVSAIGALYPAAAQFKFVR